jgi:hypothetical protein
MLDFLSHEMASSWDSSSGWNGSVLRDQSVVGARCCVCEIATGRVCPNEHIYALM